MLTHVIDAPLPEPNSTILLYFFSNDFPSVRHVVFRIIIFWLDTIFFKFIFELAYVALTSLENFVWTFLLVQKIFKVAFSLINILTPNIYTSQGVVSLVKFKNIRLILVQIRLIAQVQK